MRKRDNESVASSKGSTKSSEHRRSGGGSSSGGSPFSLSRFLSSRTQRRNRSKSRSSLDSDSARSESSLASHTVVSTSLPTFHSSTVGASIVRTSNMTVVTTSQASCNLNASSSLPVTSSTLQYSAALADASRECPVCMTEQTLENFPPIQTCHHRSCIQCLRQYLQIEISESRINIACPECNEQFHPNDMQLILGDAVMMGKYEDFMLRRVLAMDPDTRWCPAPDCG